MSLLAIKYVSFYMFNNTYSNIFAAIVSYGKLLSLSTFEVLIKNEFLTPLSMPARQ
jgi:hypothetical protein